VALTAGTRLGRYEIQAPLGRGGTGVVFLAHDTTLHRQVALKLLASLVDDGTARNRLLREARNAAGLNHPNICTIYEVGEADGHAFIAMEYVEGRPLSDWLAESALPLADTVRYGIEAADALAYAHDHGVVHRDLKAANAIVTKTGRLKLVDFGLARREDALAADATTLPSLAPSGAAVGTPYAMAPEQVRGGLTDSRTDIWALGVLLYEMASGAKPFSASTIPELFSSILRDVPAPLSNAVPPDLQLVIERCLTKEPGRRYQRAGEVRTELEAMHASTTPMWISWRAWRKRRGAVAAGAGVALIVLLVAANVVDLGERLKPNPAVAERIKLAVLPFENLSSDPEQEYFSDGLTEELITQLGRLHPQRLTVIARTSSMQYKKRDASVVQIGHELGVDYLLEGSARRDGQRVRVSATLIQVRDQSQLWADSFDRDLTSILVLQSDVARSVAGSLRLALLPAEQTRLAGARPVNPDAYEVYLKGMSHMQRQTQPDLDLAQKYFEMALQNDPDYAPAYAGVASVWNSRNFRGYVPPSEAAPRAKAAALKALELDGELAHAHRAIALVAWAEFDWETSDREYRRAIELDPGDSIARTAYSQVLMALRRPEEAVSQAERGLQLDPLSPTRQASYGSTLYFARRYKEAIAQLQKAARTIPDSPGPHCGLWHAYNVLGRPKEALVGAEGCIGFYGPEVKDALARGSSERGYLGAMRRVADLLASGMSGVHVAPIDVHIAYLHAGDKNLALEWLSRAVDGRDPQLYGVAADPFANDSLGDDPRFQEILRRAGLHK
jgi:serine/threonine-protein kinase